MITLARDAVTRDHEASPYENREIGGEPVKLLCIDGDPQSASRWSLQELTPAFNYVAALIVEGQSWCLSCWQWSE